MDDCEICNGEADKRFDRVEIWHDDLWRLTMHRAKALGGFCYLEPLRHIPYVTGLDGAEAQTFGSVLAHLTRLLKAATRAELVYVSIYGGTIPHLHVHLAPHHAGDVFCDAIVHGEIPEELWSSGKIEVFRAAFNEED
jgi:diadenosine tetraphosphate (Ap4A) HIT family hydrolase